MDHLMMISSDCHAGAPWYIYRKYLDPQYREEYDRWSTALLKSVLDEESMKKQMPFQLETMSVMTLSFFAKISSSNLKMKFPAIVIVFVN